MTFTGFDLDEAQELFGSGSMENVKEDEFDADSAAAEITEPKTQNGDLGCSETTVCCETKLLFILIKL